MINTEDFYNYLIQNDLNFFVGVPDSLLKNLCDYIKDNTIAEKNIIAANEGNAIAIASGYHLSTGKTGVVYMQNSGVGNTINPLLSLTDNDVYNIPLLMIIGWRGEPNVKDEPQHIKQGELTIPILETLGIKYYILDENYKKTIDEIIKYIKKTNEPIALIVKKNTFSKYKSIENQESSYELMREEALEEIIDNLNLDDIIVSTTGKTSREIFEIRERNNQPHSNDFLTVGSMGHASSIALGMSLGTNKNIYCIDGDGSFIMHMGASAINAQLAKQNYKYIIINNGAHESVGGQPTVGFSINIKKILNGFGYINIYEAYNKEDIDKYMKKLTNENLSALIIYTKQGSRDNLGRPTIEPKQNKIDLMEKIIKGD